MGPRVEDNSTAVDPQDQEDLVYEPTNRDAPADPKYEPHYRTFAVVTLVYQTIQVLELHWEDQLETNLRRRIYAAECLFEDYIRGFEGNRNDLEVYQ